MLHKLKDQVAIMTVIFLQVVEVIGCWLDFSRLFRQQRLEDVIYCLCFSWAGV